MANNELSGPCLLIYLAKEIAKKINNYSVRIVFIPETIGSIYYLSRNYKKMKKNIDFAFNITCVETLEIIHLFHQEKIILILIH